MYRDTVLAFTKKAKTQDFFVFDTETTGLSAVSNDIIEFSALKISCDGDDYKVVDEIDFFVNPGYHIPENITEITGITDDDIKDAPSLREAAEKIKAFFGDKPLLMGYNSPSFDEKFLNALYERQLGTTFLAEEPHLDVLKMAREKLIGSHKLSDVAAALKVDGGIKFHLSIDDAKATFEVYKKLAPLFEEAPSYYAVDFDITAVRRWTKSENLDRIYVNTSNNASIYYDLVSEEWVIAGGKYDKKHIERLVFDYMGVDDIEDLVTACL